MKKMNFHRYSAYPSVFLPDRKWPDKQIVRSPKWCSVDLRDGNQALDIPMDSTKKMELFLLLADIGFKEIEVGFPSASQTDFDFTRQLIEKKIIPRGVAIQVLTQARENLIRKTFESLRGVKKAIVHIYNSTSETQRRVVFGKSKEEIIELAVNGITIIKDCMKSLKKENITLEYSPESFTGTELEYALEITHKVIDEWNPSPENKIIINLPATVEMSNPNVYADRIEWFCKNIKKRNSVLISVHTHNDRGCAVAAAELAILAGADRIEGSLFGNGERSGNMDIVTMALNLFSSGIDPELDFTNINRVIEIYKKCTGMSIHPRHPYAGELVYTAFSGSHQDAINKGIKQQKKSKSEKWDVPYLPIDPADVGRTYEAIIRINSQSGKGGAAYIMENEFGITIPKWLQPHFGKAVQNLTDSTGRELNSIELKNLFFSEYIEIENIYNFIKCHIDTLDTKENSDTKKLTVITAVLEKDSKKIKFTGKGNGPVDAFVKGFTKISGINFKIENYSEHSIDSGSDASAIAYTSIKTPGGKNYCAAAIDPAISIATIKAVLNTINKFQTNKNAG